MLVVAIGVVSPSELVPETTPPHCRQTLISARSAGCPSTTGSSSRCSETGIPLRSPQTVCSFTSRFCNFPSATCAQPRPFCAAPARRSTLAAFSPGTEDLISAVEFDGTGDYLATGDRGGRVVIFEASTVSQKRAAAPTQAHARGWRLAMPQITTAQRTDSTALAPPPTHNHTTTLGTPPTTVTIFRRGVPFLLRVPEPRA